MENNKLIETLYNDIQRISNKNVNDTLFYALKLLHSLSRDINKSMYIILKNEVSCVSFIIQYKLCIKIIINNHN